MTKVELNVLLVEDNPADVLFLREALAQDALAVFELTVVESLAEALTSLAQQTFAAALLDLGLPDSQGLSTFREIHRAAPDLPLIILSALSDEEVAMQALQAGAQDYLVKRPQEFSAAGRALRYAIERQRSQAALRESEERFAALFRSNPVPIGITRASDYRIVDVNNAWTKMTGYTREEAIGYTSTELGLARPDTLQHVRDLLDVQPKISDHEIFLYTRSSQQRQMLISTEAIELGGATYFLTNLLDITERKQAEKLVRQWADAFENCAHGIAIGLPVTNQIMTCNPAFARLQGRTIEEISAMPILSMYAPEDRAHVIKNIMEADRQGSIRYEARMVRKDGTRYPVQMDVVSVRDEAGNILYRVATQQDITERKQAEEKLRESETLLRQVLESTQDAIFAIDREYRLLVNNDAHQQVLVATGGHPLQAGENVLPPDYPPPMLEDWRAMYDRAFGGESTHLELEWTDIYGKPRAYENNILPLRDAAGTIVGVLATAHDITERKQTEEKLRASEQFLKESQRIANMGSWQFDPATLKLNWSENCYRLFGFEPGEVEATLELFKQVVHPADRQLVEEASNSLLQHPRPFEYEYRIVDKHGRTKWLYNSIKPTLEGHQVVQFTGIHIDITERQQATNLLQQQTEKLRILYAASRQLSSTLDLKVIYETVSDLMGEVAPNDGLMISHFDPHRRLITCQAYKLDRQWQNVAEFPPIPLEDEGRGTQSRVILTGQPLLLNDYRAYGQTARTRYIFDSETGTLSDITADTSEADLQDLPGSALLVPLKSGGAVTGVLQLFCNRRAAYTDDHLQLLEALAVHISAAEQNARLYAQTQAELGERTAAEEKLSASEQQLQALVTSLDDIVFEVDERGTYRNIWTANDAMLFLPREQIIGRRFDEIFGAEASRPFFDYLERCLQSGQPQNLEYPMELPGRVRWFNARYNLIRSGTAKPKTASVMVRDITRRKQAEAALAESENRFRALIEHSSDGIVVLSAEGQVVYESPSASRLIGFTPEERQSRSGFENIHPADLPQARAKFAQLASQPGSVIQVEYRALRKGGSLWWVDVVATNLLNEPGVQGIVINFRDGTERKVAEEKLRASEERYHQAIIAAGAIPYALDYATNQYTFIGEGLEKLTGYAAHELDLNEFNAWLIESVMQGEFKGLELLRASQLVRAGQAGGIWKCQHHIRTRDGRELWLADAAVQVLNDAGLPVGSIGILQDITEHKETEKVLAERIQQATAEIQDLYDNAPAGYHSLDANGCFAQINQTELNWLGYTRAEVIGRPFADFATERGLATFKQNYPGFKQRGWLRDLEIEFLRKDGTTFQALVNATAIWDKDGRYVMSRSTVLDISERKQAEQELRDSRDRLDLANRELERVSRAKDEFLANMSHELRTPLNAVLGMAQSLGEQYIGPLNPRQLEAAAVIETSGRHLLELINDILDLSKIESGNVTLDLTAVDVPTICRASLLFIKQVAHRKNIQVSSRFDAAVTGLSADERRLKQMLVNLLNNAVKFTPEGGQVELTVTGDRAAQTVQFTIRDTGIGIAPADLPRLFKPFVQLDSGLTRQYEGTGLGLSIVLRLAQLHGGSVTAASEPGQGSVFTITLPWTEPAPTPAGEPAPLAAFGPTPGADQPAPLILIAEDNEANILTLRTNFEPRGYRLVVARHGGEVLEKVQIARPALILLDLQMPVMDGLETLRRLRSNPDPGLASLPVIALTALAMPADRDRALAAGANAFLPKPINVRQLMDLIQHLLQEH